MKIYNNVSTSQFSIARHYGGLKINGEEYYYDHLTDCLINKKDLKEWKKLKKEKPIKANSTQLKIEL